MPTRHIVPASASAAVAAPRPAHDGAPLPAAPARRMSPPRAPGPRLVTRTRRRLACAMLAAAVVGCGSDDGSGPEPVNEASAVAALRASLVPLAANDSLGDGATTALRAAIQGADVIGLGEATHGTREFFLLKNQVIRALADSGLTTVAFEAPWASTRTVDAFVRGGAVSEAQAITALQYAVWRTEEVRELLRFLREANAARPADRRIRYVGVDPQDYALFQGGGGTLAQLDTLLSRVVPDVASDVRTAYAQVLATADSAIRAERLTPEQAARLSALTVAAAQRIAGAEGALTAAVGADDAAWAVRSGEVLRQQIEQSIRGGQGLLEAAFTWRDSSMASNLLWWRSRAPSGGRIVLWGHNGHIGDLDREGTLSLGYFLRRQLGSAYSAVGFAFASGQYNANLPTDPQIVGAAPSGTIDATLADASSAPFLLDLRRPTPTLASWAEQAQGTRWLGAGEGSGDGFAEVSLRPTFDVLLFIPTVTPSRPLR